jgi:membrane protease YdiL (CAAX protease family)
MEGLGRALQEDRAAQVAEIVLVFLVAFAVVAVGWRLVGDNPFARQAVVWVANVLMLVTIWIGLRLRRQTWEHFGLSFHFGGRRALVRTVLKSICVLVVALAAFVAGSVLTMNMAAAPESADMSGYDYLRGNLPMLLLALAGVYVVSSFGEEVIYRGFLVNRLAEMGKGGKAAWSIAVVISAVVFGLAHFDWGIVGVVQTTFMGLALAISYLVVKRNLWVLVLAHAYIDTLLFVQLYLGPAADAAG